MALVSFVGTRSLRHHKGQVFSSTEEEEHEWTIITWASLRQVAHYVHIPVVTSWNQLLPVGTTCVAAQDHHRQSACKQYVAPVGR